MILLTAMALALAAPDTDEWFMALLNAQQPEEAIAYLERGVAQDDPDSANILAQLYDQGDMLVEQDHARAAQLYRQAAQGGIAYAQWRLGVVMDLGEGVESNPQAAIQWFSLAAAQDFADALVSLAVMHATGRGTRQDYAKALDLYERAARAGAMHGFYGLGVMHALGEGVAADPQEAMAYLIIADTMGVEDAGRVLGSDIFLDVDVDAARDRATEIFEQYFPETDDNSESVAGPQQG